jgi:hypothetical protein
MEEMIRLYREGRLRDEEIAYNVKWTKRLIERGELAVA